jgi:hypothetical protein
MDATHPSRRTEYLPELAAEVAAAIIAAEANDYAARSITLRAANHSR